MINEKSKFPEFCLKDEENKDFCIKDIKSKWKIIYFYPKDNTPGCTNEAMDFSKLKEEFERENTFIIGISADSIDSHKKFKEKYNLKIKLLSDPKKEIIKKLAWGKKKLYGREYEGIIRTTYLLNENNEIIKVWKNVKVKGHAEEVLNFIKELNKQNKQKP